MVGDRARAARGGIDLTLIGRLGQRLTADQTRCIMKYGVGSNSKAFGLVCKLSFRILAARHALKCSRMIGGRECSMAEAQIAEVDTSQLLSRIANHNAIEY